jgi:hypothetical protein
VPPPSQLATRSETDQRGVVPPGRYARGSRGRVGRAARPVTNWWWRGPREQLRNVLPSLWLEFLFEPRDLWVGVYWTRPDVSWNHALDIYVCVVPCFPLLVRWRRRARLFGVWGFKTGDAAEGGES